MDPGVAPTISLAMDEGSLYWTRGNEVVTIPKDGGAVVTLAVDSTEVGGYRNR